MVLSLCGDLDLISLYWEFKFCFPCFVWCGFYFYALSIVVFEYFVTSLNLGIN